MADSGQRPVRTVTLADVLALPVIRAGRPEVMAGRDRLDRPVRWVHVTELLDPASFLEGGELILTTGMPQADDPTRVRDYVDQLADVGTAGLVVELGRRYQRVPDALVHACRARDLPLIVLGRGVLFIEITQTVHALILDAQGELLRRAQGITDAFAAMAARGAPAGEIVTAAAELAGCPAILENLVHQAVICAPGGSTVGRVLTGWPRRSHMTPTPDRTEPAGAEGWLVTPLERDGARWGRLILVPDAADPATGPEHAMVAERAAAALNLTRAPGYGHWERDAHRTVLRDLIDRRFRTATDARHRAEALGMPVAGHRLVAVVVNPPRPEEREEFAAQLAAHLAASGVRALVGETSPGHVGALIALARTTAWQPVAHRIGRFAAETLGPDAVVAVGPGVSELADVARSFHEAGEVIEAIRPGTSRRPFHTEADIGLPELLRMLRDDPRLQRYVQRQLGRLIAHDARHDGDLVGTLRHYLEETGNTSAAAKRSGLSRQAFYQRIRTIERVTAADLSDGAHQMRLHVALAALDAITPGS
jgi:purine catabolism regulator